MKQNYLLLLLVFCLFVHGQEKYQKVRIFYTDVNQVSKIIEQGQIDHYKEKKGDYIESYFQIFLNF